MPAFKVVFSFPIRHLAMDRRERYVYENRNANVGPHFKQLLRYVEKFLQISSDFPPKNTCPFTFAQSKVREVGGGEKMESREWLALFPAKKRRAGAPVDFLLMNRDFFFLFPDIARTHHAPIDR